MKIPLIKSFNKSCKARPITIPKIPKPARKAETLILNIPNTIIISIKNITYFKTLTEIYKSVRRFFLFLFAPFFFLPIYDMLKLFL